MFFDRFRVGSNRLRQSAYRDCRFNVFEAVTGDQYDNFFVGFDVAGDRMFFEPGKSGNAGGLTKTPVERGISSNADLISSSVTEIKPPFDGLKARIALRRLRGIPTAIESAMVFRWATNSPVFQGHFDRIATGSLCTPMIRGRRSESPSCIRS